MSELANNLMDVVLDRAAATTDTVKNTRTGALFTAEIESNLDPFTIPEEFSRDARAKFRLHVTSDAQAKGILKNDIVTFNIYGTVTTAKIVQADFDPASPQTKFLAIHLVNGKDA